MIDDQLPFDARALIAAGRERLGPDAATIARLRTRVDAAVISPAPAAAHGLAIKLALVTVLGGGAYVLRDLASQPRVIAPSIELEARSADDIEVQARGSLVVLEQAVAAPAREARRIAVLPQPSVATPIAEPVVATPVAEPVGASLAREIELVDHATASLHTRDLEAALAVLQTYSIETAGRGQLAQDAAALRIEVLCRKHDDAGTAELATFTERWPRSPQRVHLTTVCTEVPK